MKYQISWDEIHSQTVEVEADSREDAIDLAVYEEDKETEEVRIDHDTFYVELIDE